MIFPEYLKNSGIIGVTAMSHSIEKELDQERFQRGAEALRKKGYKVEFTENVFRRADGFGRSSTGEEKAKEFNALVADPEVKMIHSAAGGDFLAEMLPYVDIEQFKANPKWVQGYSDNTSILYYLTTKADVATVYGANFSDYGMKPWGLSVKRGLQVLEGKCQVQESFKSYQKGFGSRETGMEGYAADARVKWNILKAKSAIPAGISLTNGKAYIDKEASVKFTGRLLGGCLDVLLNLAGTKFDGTLEFIEKYKEDGVIWYLESFALPFEGMMEGLWKLKEMGWFETAKGFVFGRPLFYATEDYSGEPLPAYEAVLTERLGDLNVPIITGADIGHKGPQFITINGALAEVECASGKGKMTYLA